MRYVKMGSLCGLALAVIVSLFTARISRTDAKSAPDAADRQPAASQLGKKIADFTLPDGAGKPVALADFKGKKAVVVVFIGTQCPVNNYYMPRLVELHKEYAEKGVQFLAVNSNRQDSAEEIAQHAKQHSLPFPVLKDEAAKTADLFAAQRTPEAFLLDGERTVRYLGRIDDQYGIGFQRAKPTRRDLAEALDEVLASKPVGTAQTAVAGCLIGRPVKPKADGQVTFSKHVAPILQKHCQECHRPGQIGPMALLTYDDAAAWSGTIREVVQERRMPPWHADPKHGKFSNDRSLPKANADTLLAWVEQGCPQGDAKDLPAPKEFASVEWTIGKPDVVFTMPREFTVPAQTPRGGIPYQYYIVPTNFKEDMWVQAVEARPGNRAVVHHILVYARTLTKGNARDGIGDGLIATQAPGELPTILPQGTAKKIPKGAAIVFQMHYTPNGTELKDRSSVGLIFAKEPPKTEARTRAIAGRRIVIPAGDANYQVTSTTTFAEDVQLLSMLPHMHLRGKSFEYRVTPPTGKEEILLSVPRYDFGWQANYRLDKPLTLPAGTRIDCTAYFDNSANNPNNPDPTKQVRWGDQTWEEMMIGFVDYAVPVK
jgi:peroxiredoxin